MRDGPSPPGATMRDEPSPPGAAMRHEPSPPGATVRQSLRLGTAAAHERLHGLQPFADLAAGRLTRAGYAALLHRLFGFHLAVEASLAAAPSLARFGIDLGARRRSGMLRQDLRVLGAPAPGTVMAPLPRITTAAEAMGRLYVTEGATLGGRILARGLDRLLGPGDGGRAFLLGHGARHGAMWAGFCAALELCGAGVGCQEGLLRGAEGTFAAFEGWFTAPGWVTTLHETRAT